MQRGEEQEDFARPGVEFGAEHERQQPGDGQDEGQVDHFAGQLGGQDVVEGRERAQQPGVQPAGADHVAEGPVGLGVGELVDEDQGQVVAGELGGGHPADRGIAGGAVPDEEVHQGRDHPAEGQQEEEAAILHPGEPGALDQCPSAAVVHSLPSW